MDTVNYLVTNILQNICSEEKINSYKFGKTWRWVNMTEQISASCFLDTDIDQNPYLSTTTVN